MGAVDHVHRAGPPRAITFLLALTVLLGFGFSGGAAMAAGRDRGSSVKLPIVGLVDKGTQAPYVQRQPWPTATPDDVTPDADAFSGFVVNETWAQLEPRQGYFTFAPLDRSLTAVSAYNREHPGHHLAVKLRLWGGFTAPEWAKSLGGTAPVTFMTPKSQGTTGRWWTTAYRAAWSTFQHKLAARFDSDPLIRTVAVSSCSTLTDEPFVFSPNPALHAELLADGWSAGAQQQCLEAAFADYSGWKRTPVEYTFNPFVSYTGATNTGTPDLAFTDAVMTRCADLRLTVGRSCILSNHALAASGTTPLLGAPIYAEIDSLYAQHPRQTPIDFQTFSPDTFGGCAAINVAVAYHAQSVELWPPAANIHGFKGFSAYPYAELVQWAHALGTQTPLAC